MMKLVLQVILASSPDILTFTLSFSKSCRPCEETFCTKSERIKKNEGASCQSAGGNLLQIHCTSSKLWYYGARKPQLPYYRFFNPVQARAERVIHQLEELNWLPISYI